MTYALDDLASYHGYSVSQGSGDRAKALIQTFYNYNLNEGGYENVEPIFAENITYFSHELNSSTIWNKRDVFQGYMMLTMAKILNIKDKPIEGYRKNGENRDI